VDKVKYYCCECGSIQNPYTSSNSKCQKCFSSEPLKTIKGNKTFNVGFWYTEYGNVEVKADSEEQAEEIVNAKLSFNGLKSLGEYNCNDRDYDSQDAELIA
jgi:hypothetical protein